MEKAGGNTGCGNFGGVIRSVLLTRVGKRFWSPGSHRTGQLRLRVSVGDGQAVRNRLWAPPIGARVPRLLARLEQGVLQSLPQRWSRPHQLRMLGTRFCSGNFLPVGIRPWCFHAFATRTLVRPKFPLPAAVLCHTAEQAGLWNSPGGQVGRKVPSETPTGQQTALLPRPAGEAGKGEGLKQLQEFKPCG